EHPRFNATLGTSVGDAPLRIQFPGRGADCQRRHQVATCPAARNDDGGHFARERRPRWRPIDTSTPAEKSAITSDSRPTDMNGKVGPVVGTSQVSTRAGTMAAIATVAVRPAARYAPNGSRAVRDIRNPSQQNTA